MPKGPAPFRPASWQPALPRGRFIVEESPNAEAVPLDVVFVGGGPAGLAASLDPGEAPDGEAYVAYAEALQAAYAERLRGMGAGGDADRASCTSHLGAADRDGTVVALTQTLLSPFGAKVMLPETGILMNNGIMMT